MVLVEHQRRDCFPFLLYQIFFCMVSSHQISSIFIKLRIDSTQIVLDPSCMALKGINCADLVIRNHVTDI